MHRLSGLIIIFYVAMGGYLAMVWDRLLLDLCGDPRATVVDHRLVGGLTNTFVRLVEINPGLVSTPGSGDEPGLLS